MGTGTGTRSAPTEGRQEAGLVVGGWQFISRCRAAQSSEVNKGPGLQSPESLPSDLCPSAEPSEGLCLAMTSALQPREEALGRDGTERHHRWWRGTRFIKHRSDRSERNCPPRSKEEGPFCGQLQRFCSASDRACRGNAGMRNTRSRKSSGAGASPGEV